MRRSLQARLMATFLLMIALLAGLAALILVHARSTTETYQRSISDLVSITELTQAVDKGAATLGRMAAEAPPARATEFFAADRQSIHQKRQGLPTSTVNPASARLMQDLFYMADSFLIESGAAIHAFRAGNLELYFLHDREAAVVAGYVRDAADRLLASELDQYRKVYPEVMRRDRQLLTWNLVLLSMMTLVAVVYAWSFARGVSDPLRALARAAGRIAAGDLEGPPVPVGSGDEVQVLGGAFNHMQENLRQHVAELKVKAELDSLLRETELRALQSQVNPHFLFNTLNLVAKTALIEGADRTQSLLETVSDLLRYSLRQLDRPVTLADEVAQVGRYMTIQGQRFRERIRFATELDEAALSTPIPCLILQPLVENAVIHGIGAREEGGEIRLTIRCDAAFVYITVADDGVGIKPDEAKNGGGHTTGLGLHSVRRRLELFCGPEANLTIQSMPSQGTTVSLQIPAAARGVA